MLLTTHPLISSTERITRSQRPQDDKLWDHISYSASRRTTQGYVFLQDALTRRGSLIDVVQLASREHTCHDTTNGKCYNCDTVAMYYLLGIEWVLKQGGQDQPIACTSDLLELVWQMCQMVLAHADASFQVGEWYTPMKKQLWVLAKQLKEETSGSDCYVVNSPTTTTPSSPLVFNNNNNNNNYFQQHHVSILSSPPSSPMVYEGEETDMLCDEQENYRRAIRITIYNCRALVYQQSDETDKAMTYFRKCIAVPAPTLESQKLLRQSAIVSLDRLSQQSFHTTTQSSRSSSISSGSGGSASSSSSCGNCGVEKRTMPVCAKCRAKFYCSAKCLVAHKIAHEKECKGRAGLRK